MEKLEIKRAELNSLVNNCSLSCEIVVRKAREFEELANKTYGLRDGSYWMQRSRKLEKLLRDVTGFCLAVYFY